MDIIIVESPTKAKTLSRFLGGAYQIEASFGHIRDLPASKLGIDVERNFTPDYIIPKDKKEKVEQLRREAGKAQSVILATDPDREGEAIAYHLREVISGKAKFQRITFHEITEPAIKEALKNPGEINMQLVDAQQARRILDRLVGYKLSPLLWRKIRRGLSAGRVQSVAVRLIVEREREILAFKPEEYWEIVTKLKVQSLKLQEDGGEFEAKLTKIDGKSAEIRNKGEADVITAELEKAEFKVSDVQKKEVKRSPYPPFTTSTMQQSASNLFGWSAKRTMQVAQNLYEEGLITYHRTDSTNLNMEAVNNARNFIRERFGNNYAPEEPRFYKTKSKVAQEAHEAIRPTRIGELEQVKQQITGRDEERLYELIWKRFLACQMSETVFEQTGADINVVNHEQNIGNPDLVEANSQRREYLLRANGSKRLFDGWTKLFGSANNNNDDSNGSDKELPELTAGDLLQLLGILPSQHFTEPPPRYTEASLIKALEEYGIGRPSTYAPIISTILERFYVERLEKKLHPTALGIAVNDFLIANFPEILNYQFTAGMEESLDDIANGKKQWVGVIRDFYDPFAEQLGKVGDTAERVKVETETTDEVCPLDGSPLIIRIGKFGRFLACSKFPECKFTKTFAKKIDVKCPKCGGDIIIKRTRSKKTFYGCSNYPQCDFASWTKPKAVNVVEPAS